VSTSATETTITTARRRFSQRLRSRDEPVASTADIGVVVPAAVGPATTTPRKAARTTSVQSPLSDIAADEDELPAKAAPSKKARRASLHSREGTGDPSLYEVELSGVTCCCRDVAQYLH
jgi:hypothetical protein